MKIFRKFKFDPLTTVLEAIAFVEKNRDEGCICPVCNQQVKTYTWKMYRMTVYLLWWLRKQPGFTGHYKDFIRDYGKNIAISNFSTPRYWNFIRPIGKKSGEWHLTQDGFDFLNGKPFPKYAKVTNRIVLGYSREQIRIRISASEQFDYEEYIAEPKDIQIDPINLDEIDQEDNW